MNSMLRKFAIAIALLATSALGAHAQQFNPDQMNWTTITGADTPILTCAPANYGQLFQRTDVTPNKLGSCGADGWQYRGLSAVSAGAQAYSSCPTATGTSGQMMVMTVSSTCAMPLPAIVAGYNVAVQVGTTSTVSIAPPGGVTLYVAGTSASTLAIPNGQTVFITTDGTSYYATAPLVAGSHCTATPTSTGNIIDCTGTGFTAAGDLSGSSTSQNVIGIQGKPLPTLAAGYIYFDGVALNWKSPANGAVVTSNTTASCSEVLRSDATGAVTISLPTIAPGCVVSITRGPSAGVVTIDPGAVSYDGVTTQLAQGMTAAVWTDGTAWHSTSPLLPGTHCTLTPALTGNTLDCTGSGGSGVQYNPANTQYLWFGNSSLIRNGSPNLANSATITCDSSAHCTIPFTSTTGLVVGHDLVANTGILPSCMVASAYPIRTVNAGVSVIVDASVVAPTCASTSGAGGIFWNGDTSVPEYTGLNEPFYAGHGTTQNFAIGGTNLAYLVTNYTAYLHPKIAAAVASGAPVFVHILTAGDAGPTTDESNFLSLWASIHGEGSNVYVVQHQIVNQAGNYNTIGSPRLMQGRSAENSWLFGQQSKTNAPSTGQYVDKLIPLNGVVANSNMYLSDLIHFNDAGTAAVARQDNLAMTSQDNALQGDVGANTGYNNSTAFNEDVDPSDATLTSMCHWNWFSGYKLICGDPLVTSNPITYAAINWGGIDLMRNPLVWDTTVNSGIRTVDIQPDALAGSVKVDNYSGTGNGDGILHYQFWLGNASTAPSGSCSTNGLWVAAIDGSLTRCLSGTWTIYSSGFTNPMTTLGDTIYGGASGVATRLAGPTTNAHTYFFGAQPTGSAVAPAWIDFAAPPAIGGTTPAAGSFSSLLDSALTSGNCVQATTGGLLTTTSGACGTSSGTLTPTGSPTSGDIAAWSGPTSLTTATATQVNTLIKTLTGCNAATNVYVPQSGTCVAPSGGAVTNLCSAVTLTNATCSGGVISFSAVSSFTISAIPGTYIKLELDLYGFAATGNSGAKVWFNADTTTSHYPECQVTAFSNTSNFSFSAANCTEFGFLGASASSTPGTLHIVIPFYASSNNPKELNSYGFESFNPSAGSGGFSWASASAITSLQFFASGGGNITGTALIYGVN